MSTPVDSIISFVSVIIADDVPGLLKLLSTDPELLSSSLTKYSVNPLLIAFKHGCINVFKEIARLKPELAQEKDQGGYTVMHLAAMSGDIPGLKILLELDNSDQLCCLEDDTSMIPLQTAVIKGHTEVIKELIVAYPSSLERVTYRRETLFHLALSHNQLNAFQVLMDEMKKLNEERLYGILNWRDSEGNTVLHIATANKFIGILNLLLPENPTSHMACSIEVNSLNNNGLTPLDLHYQNISAKNISYILRNAGSQKGCHAVYSLEMLSELENQATETNALPHYSMQTLGRNNLQLVLYVMLVGAAINIVFSPPSFNLKDRNSAIGTVFEAKSILYGELPIVFYLMVFNTAGFTLGMGLIVILLWSFSFRIATLLTATIMFIIYGLMLVQNKVLKFSVIFGQHGSLSAVVLVWLSGIAFIFTGVLVLKALKYISFLRYNKSAEKPKIQSINQMEIQKYSDEEHGNEIQTNCKPGTLTSSFAKRLMTCLTAPTHSGEVPLGAEADH